MLQQKIFECCNMVIHVLQKGSTNVEIVQFGISIVEITFLNVVAVKGDYRVISIFPCLMFDELFPFFSCLMCLFPFFHV
jgi:hypothetical protein